jgi:hypothetical protein
VVDADVILCGQEWLKMLMSSYVILSLMLILKLVAVVLHYIRIEGALELLRKILVIENCSC